MPQLFSSGSGGVEFSDLGMTSIASGITSTITLFNSSTGATTPASFVPNQLNYILSSDNGSQTTTVGSTAIVGLTNSVVSLTIVANRPVEIQALGATTTSQVQVSGDLATASNGIFHLFKGVTSIQQQRLSLQCDIDTVLSRGWGIPPSAFKFVDFPVAGGGVTYSFGIQPVGATSIVTATAVKIFVRQL